MKSYNRLLWAVHALVWCGIASAERSDVSIPVTVVEPTGQNPTGLRMQLAAFGSIPYGELMGSTRFIVFPDLCTCGEVKCSTGCADFSLANHPSCPVLPSPTDPDGTLPTAFLIAEPEPGQNSCKRSIRAYNVAKAGGSVAIILAPEEATSLVASVNSNAAEAGVEQLLFAEHVHIVVGMMNSGHSAKLLEVGVTAHENKQDSVISLDFRSLFHPPGTSVNVEFWHDTDDNCGVFCIHVHAFIHELGTIAADLPDGHPIQIAPRFRFESCPGNANSELCKRNCVNNGRYCHFREGGPPARAPVVVRENIRQLCLWNVLKDKRKFMLYKMYFQENCRTDARTFNDECGDKAFDFAGEGESKKGWEECLEGLGKNQNMDVVQREMADEATQEIATAQRATVVIKDQHFRGDLDAAHVMKAACSALDGPTRSGPAQKVCDTYTLGTCRPGGREDRTCQNLQHTEAHRTHCKEMNNPNGFGCVCDAGYKEVLTEGGDTPCVDENECQLYPSLCNRFINPRAGCLDVEGSFQCIENIANLCTEANNWNDCWTGTFNGIKYHSCEDRVAYVRGTLQNGVPYNPADAAQCNCEAIKGCWKGGSGSCEPACSPSDCDFETSTCKSKAQLNTAGAVGVSFGVIGFAALAAVVGFLMYRRHKKSKDVEGAIEGAIERAADVATSASVTQTQYPGFKDGLDADEIARTGASNYIAGIEGRPPVNGATQYAENSFVDQLSVQEVQPEA